jgi:hypothetical protein
MTDSAQLSLNARRGATSRGSHLPDSHERGLLGASADDPRATVTAFCDEARRRMTGAKPHAEKFVRQTKTRASSLSRGYRHRWAGAARPRAHRAPTRSPRNMHPRSRCGCCTQKSARDESLAASEPSSIIVLHAELDVRAAGFVHHEQTTGNAGSPSIVGLEFFSCSNPDKSSLSATA